MITFLALIIVGMVWKHRTAAPQKRIKKLTMWQACMKNSRESENMENCYITDYKKYMYPQTVLFIILHCTGKS